MLVTWKGRENVCPSETESIKIPCNLKLLEALLELRGKVYLRTKLTQRKTNQQRREMTHIPEGIVWMKPWAQPYLKPVQLLDFSVISDYTFFFFLLLKFIEFLSLVFLVATKCLSIGPKIAFIHRAFYSISSLFHYSRSQRWMESYSLTL